jgi:putative inorganic carbon (HCO3(-)) transporter
MMKSQNVTEPVALETDRLSPISKSGGSVVRGLLIEAGILTSLTCFYLIGNSNLGKSWLFHLNPLYSLPFLLAFVFLCWKRLAFVVALFPLTLPYYRMPKLIYGHYALSLAEITLLICLGVALLQLVSQRAHWKYWSSWQTLRARIGLFAFPILILLISASLTATFAPNSMVGLRTFSQTVLEPIIYFLLVLLCLRTRSSLERLLWALVATGCLLAFMGIAQFLFFSSQLKIGADGIPQITVVYGNAQALGTFVDYLLPGSLALLLIGTWQGPKALRFWGVRVAGIVLCLLLLLTLCLSQVRQGEVALVVAFLFLCAFMVRNRAVLFMGASSLLIAGIASAAIFPTQAAQILLAQWSEEGVSRVVVAVVGFWGMLALSMLLLLFFWRFRGLLVRLRSASAKEQMYMQWIAVGSAGTMIAVVAQAGTMTVFFGQDTSYLFWICLAMLLLLYELLGAGGHIAPASAPVAK